MKKILGIALIAMLPHTTLSAQSDYCNRFSALKIVQEDSGYTTYISPHVNEIQVDKKQAFYQKFYRRFQYILVNKLSDEMAEFPKYIQDTAELNRRFCTLLTEDKRVRNYFAILANESQGQKDSFTKKEMMQVAARFFWLQHSEADGWLIYKCIFNNGQKESHYERDYSVLEAFCFEAIFHYLYQRKTPRFSIAADKYFDEIIDTVPKASYRDTDVLFAVRQDLYQKMEQDADLQKALLSYYRKYGNTFGFRLSDVKIKL